MQRPALSTLVAAWLVAACGADPTVQEVEGNWPGDAPGPAGVGPGVRVFDGTAATLSATRSCTAEEGAEGDRWCAFVGRSSTGDDSLFVVNVSKVTAGAPVSCGDPDPHCLLLTDRFAGSSADFHPTYFGGDTLVYYDRELTAYVWRPGMERGRVLASRAGTRDIAFCDPAPEGMAIACLAIPFEQPDASILVADLYAGVADGESEPLLAPVEGVIVGTEADTDDVHRFGFGPISGGYVAWSTRQTPEGPEVLKLQQAADPASQITVSADAHKWSVVADRGSWLWLRAVNELGIGTLQTARFPDGADPTDLLDGVVKFELEAGGSVVALTYDGNAVSIPDPIGAPDQQVLLDGEVGKIVALNDQGHVAYARRYEQGAYREFIVSRLDGTRSCLLETSGGVSLSAVQFSPGAESVLWARWETDHFDAYHSRLGACSTVPFSPDVVVIGWIGPQHAFFMDDFDPETRSASLRFRKVGRDGELHPDPPTLIAEHTDTFTTWGPDFLLYTISRGTDEDGAYLRAFGR